MRPLCASIYPVEPTEGWWRLCRSLWTARAHNHKLFNKRTRDLALSEVVASMPATSSPLLEQCVVATFLCLEPSVRGLEEAQYPAKPEQKKAVWAAQGGSPGQSAVRQAPLLLLLIL